MDLYGTSMISDGCLVIWHCKGILDTTGRDLGRLREKMEMMCDGTCNEKSIDR